MFISNQMVSYTSAENQLTHLYTSFFLKYNKSYTKNVLKIAVFKPQTGW